MSTVVVSPFATSQTIEQTVVDVAVETKPTYAVVESSGVQVNVTPDETVVQVAPVDVNVNVDPNVFYVQICTCDLFDTTANQEIVDALEDVVNNDSALLSLKATIGLYQNAAFVIAQQRQLEKLALAYLKGNWSAYNLTKYSNAMIVKEKTIREEQNLAMANQVEALVAMIGDPNGPAADTVWAEILNEQSVRATDDSALARSINVVIASIGDAADPDDDTVWAAIKSGEEADVTLTSALASQRTELLTMINGHTTTIEVLAQSIDGIEGQYGVTIDSGGFQTGFKMIGGSTSGGAAFNVDYFRVGRAGATGIYPFEIGYVNGVQMARMNGAYIGDLTIKRITLADAGVCSLSWGNANGNYWTTSGGLGLVYPSWNIPSGGTITLDVTGAHHVIVIGFIRCISSGSLNYGKLMKGTSQLFYMGEAGSETSLHGIALDSSPGTGTKAYSVQVYNPSAPSGGTGCLYAVGIMAIAFYR